MFRISIFLTVISVFFLSCKTHEKLEFVRIQSLHVSDYDTEKINLDSEVVFRNPNHIGGILQLKDINIFVNGMDMGNVNSSDFEVPSKTEFTVPINFDFPYNKIFQDKENLLVNILNALTEEKLNVSYKGVITYKNKLFSYDYPLDYSQEVSLKK